MSRLRRVIRRMMSGEQLEGKYCLAAIGFATHDIACCSAGGFVTAMQTADLDGDGDVDVLFAASDYSGRVGDKIAWYENVDGQGTFGSQRIIATTEDSAVLSVYAADIDGDGDVDVLSGSVYGDTIAWYENSDGKGTFSNPYSITTKADRLSSVHTADLDGDGDVDVLSASSGDDTIAWYENTDANGAIWRQHVITKVAHEAQSRRRRMLMATATSMCSRRRGITMVPRSRGMKTRMVGEHSLRSTLSLRESAVPHRLTVRT